MDICDQQREGGHWNPHFSRNLNDSEVERFNVFLLRLQGKAMRRDEKDGLKWMDAEKGKFSVTSFYTFLR